MDAIKVGMWIAYKGRKGVYLVADMDGEYITLKDVLIRKDGVVSYGRKRMITVKDLDNYVMA
jgi:hypothetical protein